MNIPKKFQNEDGTLNTDAMIKSYGELEKKIGTMVSVPTNDADESTREKFARACGVPADITEYPSHPLLDVDDGLKQKFMDAGLNKAQVEKMYELATEYMTPAIENIFMARHENDSLMELENFFGGAQKTFSALGEIKNFGEKFLPTDTYENLSSSVDGIKTIYKMMQTIEPKIATDTDAAESLTESDLKNMMRDPKYWRDMDSEYIRKVEGGFKKLFS